MKILLIEDEKELSATIQLYLTKGNYLCETALTYESAIEKINLYQYDCVIVDITLPDGNGLNIIRELKENKIDTGIIIISAKNSLDDRITGLDIGADDYLTKPFHLSELNARIKSIIRRRNFGGTKEIIFNEIRILPEHIQVFVHDTEIQLTKKEFDLLMFFISNKSRVLTKEAIAEHLWGEEIDMADSYDFIYTHIKNLRKKLLENASQDYIQTIYGMGYKFLAE
jgi:DNA-binding response OmpR family regulator